MNDNDSLTVDLTSLEDIRAKLPLARDLYERKQEALVTLNQEVETWRDLVNLLARSVGEPGIEPPPTSRRPTRRRAPGQERAIQALERAGRPMGPKALFSFMNDEGMDAPTNVNALGANLWAAEKAGRIKKTNDGEYAPLGWEPDQGSLATEAAEEKS